MNLRPFELSDAPDLIALENLERETPGTVEEFEHGERTRPTGYPLLRLVAEGDDGLVGFGAAGGGIWLPEGRMFCRVQVHPDHRQRGVGRALYNALQPFVSEHRPPDLRSGVKDTDANALAWAERRGFQRRHHIFNSTLELAELDDARFAGVADRARADSIRFVSFAELRTPENEHRLWELSEALLRDVPDAEDRPSIPFEQWRKFAFEGPAAWPEGVLIAVDGEDAWVGLTALAPVRAMPGRVHTNLTGVVPSHRGRGLALALKLAAIAFAREHGYTSMSTNNHSANAPMLAVNRKLGYVPTPGFYSLIKTLK